MKNSDRILTKAEGFVNKGRIESAVEIIDKQITADKGNIELYIKAAELYTERGEFDLAHGNYQTAGRLNPLESNDIIRQDYNLYLNQAEKLLGAGNVNGAIDTIYLANSIYSPFGKKYGLPEPDEENLNQYIEMTQSDIENRVIRLWELKEIFN